MKTLPMIPLVLILAGCTQPTIDEEAAAAALPLIVEEIEYLRGDDQWTASPEELARIRRLCLLAGIGSAVVEGGAVPEDVRAACDIALGSPSLVE